MKEQALFVRHTGMLAELLQNVLFTLVLWNVADKESNISDRQIDFEQLAGLDLIAIQLYILNSKPLSLPRKFLLTQ